MGLKKHQPQGANPSIKSGHSVASMIGASKSAFKMKGSSFHMTQGQEAFVDAVAKKNPTAAGKIAKGIDSPAKNYGKIVPQMQGDPNKRMDKLSAKHKSLYDKFEMGQTSESEEARMHRLEDRMDRVGKRVKKKESKKKKSPLNKTKEERKAARADRREKTGGTRIGNAIRKGKEVVDKVKNSKVGKVAKGIADTVSNVKSGKIGAAIKSGKQTIADAKSKKSDSPAEMKTPLKQGVKIKDRLAEGIIEAGGQKSSQQSSKPGKISKQQTLRVGKSLKSKIDARKVISDRLKAKAELKKSLKKKLRNLNNNQ